MRKINGVKKANKTKFRKARKNDIIAITLKEDNGNIGKYKLSLKAVSPKAKKRLYKYVSPISADKASNAYWKITYPTTLRKKVCPSGLRHMKISITNGEKTVSGIVLSASYSGGGATSPATEEGLPPNDEN